MNTDLSITFIKENCQTINDLKKRVEEQNIGIQMSVEKGGNILNTSNGYSENHLFNPSLLPQTLNFTKVKEARDNLETQQAFRELGVEIV